MESNLNTMHHFHTFCQKPGIIPAQPSVSIRPSFVLYFDSSSNQRAKTRFQKQNKNKNRQILSGFIYAWIPSTILPEDQSSSSNAAQLPPPNAPSPTLLQST